MTAPADAVVLEIAQRSLGSVVREAEPLMTLVPLDAPLQAEVQIGPDDIGFLRVGDTGRIKFDAFPFQKHGTLAATVRTISEDAFASDRSAMGSGPRDRSTEVFYRSRLDLGPVTLTALPASTRLLPGMTLSAEIIIGRRRLISYFIYPIIRGLDESLRER